MARRTASSSARAPAFAPDPATARQIAALAAGLPGADDRAMGRVAAVDTACDLHGWADAVRGVLIWREGIAWPAVLRQLGGERGWTLGKVQNLLPDELLRALQRGRAGCGEDGPANVAGAAGVLRAAA